tara:strand:- start:3237 stop:5255 length:2019 start_codon:yes stop_codon:yes gene_type:complete
MLLLLPLLASSQKLLEKPKNLTHARTFSFSDSSFAGDLDFVQGKHCADIHLHFDSHMYEYSIDSFKLCLSHSSYVPEAWFTNLRHTFEHMYTQYSYEWENMTMYDSEKYNRYQLYMSARHSLDLYKADISRSARYFSEPMNHLSLSSDEQTALAALSETGQNIDELKSSVDAIVNSYTTSIRSKSSTIQDYLDASVHAKNMFTSSSIYYEHNVTDILRKITSKPTSLYTCPKGHYCPTETSSIACPAGTYLDAANHISVDACVQCPLQTYSTSGANNCTTCTTNTNMGATACHLRSLGEVIATMDASGPIAENFYIAFDMTRTYTSNTLLSPQETALAAGKATIRTPAVLGGPARYLATSSLTLGAVVDSKTFKWGKVGEAFQINLERNSLVPANSSEHPPAGSIEYWNGDRSSISTGDMDNGNWIDGHLYDFHIDVSATELPLYTFGATPAFVQESGIQWTITAWGQTVLRGTIDTTSIPGKTRFVVKLGSNGLPEYRPFDATLDVNPQEQFTQTNTELVAYVFDGTLVNLVADTSVLVPELMTMTAEDRYVSDMSALFTATYGIQTYVDVFAESDLKSSDVVAQTDLSKWSGPYIDGSINYALELTPTTWSVSYTPIPYVILSGTREGKTLLGGTPSDRGMVEFPLSLAGAAGFPVVSKYGTPIHSYTLK